MNKFIAIAALTAFVGGVAYANPEFEDNTSTYGTILNDAGPGGSGDFQQPTGHLTAVIDQDDAYGSALFDTNEPGSPPLGGQPGIGDDADDYGNLLYDLGRRY